MAFAWLSSIIICFLIMILSAQIWAYHILDLIQLRLILMCPGDPKIENTTKFILSRWSKDYHPWYRGAPPHVHHQLETAKINFVDISYTSNLCCGVFFQLVISVQKWNEKKDNEPIRVFLEKEFVGLLAPWTSFSFEQGQLKTPFTKTRNKGHFLENMIPVCHGLPQLGRSHAEKHSLTSAPYWNLYWQFQVVSFNILY